MTDVRSMVQFANREEEEHAADALAERLGLEYINLTGYSFTPHIAQLIPPEAIERYLLVPYRRDASGLKVASPAPESPKLAAFLTELADLHHQPVSLAVCSPTSYSYAQHALQLHHEPTPLGGHVAGGAHIGSDALEAFRDPAALAQRLVAISTSEALDILFAGAMAMDATDIHLEPGQKEMTVRFRIDGVLRTIAKLPTTHYRSLRSRIKYLAKLKLDVVATPQDGRFEYQTLRKKFDVRVSSLPTGFGETFVLRLLTGGTLITLDELGFSPEQVAVIRRAIAKPNGLILNTGPTGSGKTTTLYAILSELNKPGVKIITIEDPIEYRIEGVQQSQVERERKYDFPTALRSALRQDPDIMMVGEIRDTETATIAVQAALTGHLVLSTLHTNSAAAAVPRLLDMGVKTYLLSGVINLIIAQRLVRRLKHPDRQGDARYAGRVAIAELLEPNETVETLIQQKASIDQFEQVARQQGLVPLFDDGMAKVKAGLTTEEEVRRVAQDVEG